MGKKSKWFGAVKRVFSPESRERKAKEKSLQNYRSSKWGSGIGQYRDSSDPSSSESFEDKVSSSTPPPRITATTTTTTTGPHREGVKLAAAQNQQSRNVYPVAVAPTVPSRFAGKSREEIAAIRIQTAFRGYMARRALRALRGLVRLKSLIHGNACKRQATTTLRCMQTLAKVQSQIRSRRVRMLEDNQALQRQLLLKREKEMEKLRMGNEWDDSVQSKEQVEASLLSKQDAAIRRERALAYAFTHQGKNSTKSANPMFMDPNNPQWGWSWLERWMAARPWENGKSTTTTEKDINSDRASINGAEITKSYSHRNATPPSAKKLSTPQSKSFAMKVNSASPKLGRARPDDDTKSIMSIMSIKSEINRRHSIAGSSVGDDESLSSSPAVPSYMAPTKSARARTRFQSPSSEVVIEGLEKVSGGGSVKKKLSFNGGPNELSFNRGTNGPRRHSGPPKVDVSLVKGNESNGGS